MVIFRGRRRWLCLAGPGEADNAVRREIRTEQFLVRGCDHESLQAGGGDGEAGGGAQLDAGVYGGRCTAREMSWLNDNGLIDWLIG